MIPISFVLHGNNINIQPIIYLILFILLLLTLHRLWPSLIIQLFMYAGSLASYIRLGIDYNSRYRVLFTNNPFSPLNLFNFSIFSNSPSSSIPSKPSKEGEISTAEYNNRNYYFYTNTNTNTNTNKKNNNNNASKSMMISQFEFWVIQGGYSVMLVWLQVSVLGNLAVAVASQSRYTSNNDENTARVSR